jgi:hypothetical protein
VPCLRYVPTATAASAMNSPACKGRPERLHHLRHLRVNEPRHRLLPD